MGVEHGRRRAARFISWWDGVAGESGGDYRKTKPNPDRGWNGPLARFGGRPARRSRVRHAFTPQVSSRFRRNTRRPVAAENGQVGRSTWHQPQARGFVLPRRLQGGTPGVLWGGGALPSTGGEGRE